MDNLLLHFAHNDDRDRELSEENILDSLRGVLSPKRTDANLLLLTPDPTCGIMYQHEKSEEIC